MSHNKYLSKHIEIISKETIIAISYDITVIPFVIFPPKSDDFTDFCEGENDNGQQKIFWKIILKFLFNFIKII